MTTTQRLSIRDVAPDAYKAVGAMSVFVHKGPLDKGLCALIDIRASQLNHCAWCLDMHAAEARAAGISQRQIDLVAAWHEAGSLFTAREQAALAFTEAVTLIADAGVSDDIWNAVAAEFNETEIAHLLIKIGAINVYNRMNVAVRTDLPPEPFTV